MSRLGLKKTIEMEVKEHVRTAFEEDSLIDYFMGDSFVSGVWEDKYAAEGEVTPDDMHWRMAVQFARAIKEREKTKIPHNSDFLSEFYSQLPDLTDPKVVFKYFEKFRQIIPQGSVMSMLGIPSIGSLSNCFVVGQPHDSYGGIFQKDQQLAQLMKRRGGVGTDISTLRPVSVGVTNSAGSSTGAVSFMDRLSNTTREVAQNGRRGALMITMDVRHPDIFDFVNVKRDRTKVTGANISVMLRNDFMEAVKKDGDYLLRFPCTLETNDIGRIEEFADDPYDTLIDEGDGVYVKKIKARSLYDLISENAWENAEPGQMFVDRHWEYSPDGIYPQYRGVTTNPCGEIFMQMYDACRLIAQNLIHAIDNPFTKNARLNEKRLYEISYIQQLLADALVDLELEHIDRILKKIDSDPEPAEVKQPELELWTNIRRVAMSGRRTGSGITGLGDMLASLGLDYSSEEGISMAESVMKTKMKAELDCSIDLAVEYGPFTGWDANIEYTNDSGNITGNNPFYQLIQDEFPSQFNRMYKFGRRNVSWSTVAPTGSLSIIARAFKYSNISAGLEPQFMVYYFRNKKVNPGDKNVRVDFTDQNGDHWQQFPVMMGAFKDWIEMTYAVNADELTKEKVDEFFKESPWFGSCAPDIDWKHRIEMQSAIQKYTSHSISSTINLPSDVTQDEVAEIYLYAYDKGLKGVTVYRDGCRTGVLVNESTTDKGTSFEYNDAPKRPKCLPVDVHTTVSKGVKWNVLVGLFDGKPYEVMAVPHFTNETSFELCKVKKGQYDLLKGDDVHFEDVTVAMSDEQDVITRMLSFGLRHGGDITFAVEQLNKSHGDITSFSKAIARVLKKYSNEEKMISRAKCGTCGGDNLRFEEGCLMCKDCGSGKC